MDSFLAFFDSLTGIVTVVALGAFALINLGFLAVVALKRDRAMVNKFTKPLIVADTALLLAAGGAPVANWAVGTSFRAVATVLPTSPSDYDKNANNTVAIDPATGRVVSD